MADLRILITSWSAGVRSGGSGRYALDLARALSRIPDTRVTVAAAPSATEDLSLFADEDFDRIWLNMAGRGYPISHYWQARRAAGRIGARGPFDVVHSMAPLDGSEHLPWPRVATYHGPYRQEIWREAANLTAWRRLQHAAGATLIGASQRRQLRSARRVFAMSDHSRLEARRLFGDEVDPLIIPPGVDERFCYPSPEMRKSARAKWDVPPDATVFATVRRLAERTGVRELINAFGAVAVQNPAFHLVVGGHGRLLDELRSRIDRLEVRDRIHLLGYVDEADLPAVYHAADMFVMPSIALENFGLVTVDALRTGLPVMATPVGANAEVVGDDHDCIVLRGKGVDDLVDGFRTVASGSVRLGPSRDRSEAVTSRFDWHQTALRLVECYHDVL